MSKKYKLSDYGNVFIANNYPGYCENVLGDPKEWSLEDDEFVIEYKPVAIHRVKSAVPAQFIKETE
jgi:hypothetical protein